MTAPLQAVGIMTLAALLAAAPWPRAQVRATSETETVSAETAFADAGAKERAVREALAAASASRTLLKAVHTVVADYEAIARQFPGSGYSDDALWRAARLSEDGFRTFGDEADRVAALRLLQTLVARYPSSKLVAQVPGRLAGLGLPSSPIDASPESRSPSGGETARREQARTRPNSKRVIVRGIRRLVLPDAVRVIIDLDGEAPFRDERLVNPARVFVDLSPTQALPGLVGQTLRFDDEGGVVRQIRVGRHPNDTTRVVLDADGVSSYSVYPLYSPYRLVIDCLRSAPSSLVTSAPATVPAAMPPAILPARQLAPRGGGPPLPRVEPTQGIRAAAVEPVAAASERATPVALLTPPVVIGPPRRNLDGGFSMARQLGLGVSRIVIDPGHGGHDPGAKGTDGTEAELVLDVAQRLERLLTAVPGIDVVLTRRTDEYLSLPERTAIANREKADLFLSIHANASGNRQARGIETYFLDFTNSAGAAAVAARENAASGQTMAALPEAVRAIALNSKRDESRDFATLVQRALVRKLRASNRAVRDLGVKQAPFAVLIGASMPSVLAEVSFLTNSHEAKLLKGDVYRQRIAEALFDAVRRYQRSLKRADTVARQP